MRFSKCEFCKNWDSQNVNFVKNENLKMWILWKMIIWNCEFCEKWEFETVNSVKNEVLKVWILWILHSNHAKLVFGHLAFNFILACPSNTFTILAIFLFQKVIQRQKIFDKGSCWHSIGTGHSFQCLRPRLRKAQFHHLPGKS